MEIYRDMKEMSMKAQTEMEKIATRRIAKDIIETAKNENWKSISDESHLADMIGRAVRAQSERNGIPAIFIKSAIMRIQDGRL